MISSLPAPSLARQLRAPYSLRAPRTPQPSVLVVAPPTLQRQGLLHTLREARPDLAVSPTTDTLGLVDLIRHSPPTLLILDAALPGPPLSYLLLRVAAAHPRQRLLVLGCRRLSLSLSRQLTTAAAVVLLGPHATPAELLVAVGAMLPLAPAAAHYTPAAFHEAAASRCAEPLPDRIGAHALPLLSRRELEVLRLVAEEQDNAEIANSLSLSVRTVESHRRALLQKTGARTFIGLVALALRQGWLDVIVHV